MDFNYESITYRVDGADAEVTKPRAVSEAGVKFPFTAHSTFNLIANMMGGSGGQGGNPVGFVARHVTLDAVFAAKAGPFFSVFGVTNLFDQRESDPFLDSNGRHFNPGRNFFVTFQHQF